MTSQFRLAPTPSGLLHIGNGVNIVLTAALAHLEQAQLHLRIDDLDASRVRGEYLNDIDATLDYLLPRSNFVELRKHQVYQSHRLPQHNEALQVLRDNKLVYACTCSRRQVREAQAEEGMDGDVNLYTGECRDLDLPLDAADSVWRLRTEDAAQDFVVRQRSGRPSYQLASLVDDVEMGITHIVRGADLRASTEMQLVLAKALEPYAPAYSAFAKTRFYHHPLLIDPFGNKLSKSEGSDSLRSFRIDHIEARVVYYEAARLLKLGDCDTLEDLIRELKNFDGWELLGGDE